MDGDRMISSVEARHLDWVKDKAYTDIAAAEARAAAAREDLCAAIAQLCAAGVSTTSIALHLGGSPGWVHACIERVCRSL